MKAGLENENFPGDAVSVEMVAPIDRDANFFSNKK